MPTGRPRAALKLSLGSSAVVLLLCGPSGVAGEPVIDDDVLWLMQQQPEVEHPLILVVELAAEPIPLEPLLPAVDELNTCTAKWQFYEELQADPKVPDSIVAAAYDAAYQAELALKAKYEAAYLTYAADYESIVSASVPRVLAKLQAVFGDKVRWPAAGSQLVSVKADAVDFQVLKQVLEVVPGVKRIACDLQFQSLLDNSRLDIEADKVHEGVAGVGPFTGAGVKVAIVDTGVKAGHPRLPVASDRQDFTGDPNFNCVGAHGTWVAGVVFCLPEPDLVDNYVGSAHGASLVDAKVWSFGGPGCPFTPELWAAVDWPALVWASDGAVGARVLNFSRGALHEAWTTDPNDLTARNVDWLVHTRGVCFVHACGNWGHDPDPNNRWIIPPSGSYNCISAGGYDDHNDPNRSNNTIWTSTSRGPTVDGRRKPDLCAPAVGIITTDHVVGDHYFLDPPGGDGTSFAAPHVSGVCALLLESRRGLNPRQLHAILVTNTDPILGQQYEWDPNGQAGWGMLNAYRAVQKRFCIRDDYLFIGQERTYVISRPGPGDEVVVTCAWQREMLDQETPRPGSPGNLDLYLDRKLVGTSEWSLVAASASALDNLERVWSTQASAEPFYDFRVRVRRVDATELSLVTFTVASRQAISCEGVP